MRRDARLAGMRSPEALAWSLMMLIEGATIVAYLFDGSTAARRLRRGARTLVEAHKPAR